jgi:putative modified peptide
MATRKSGGGHKPLDPAVADKLLELLSTDNGFRKQFEQDPTGAVKTLGFEVQEGVQLTCMNTNTIATKEEIAEAREAIKSFLTSAAAYNNPHCFEAGMIGPSLDK